MLRGDKSRWEGGAIRLRKACLTLAAVSLMSLLLQAPSLAQSSLSREPVPDARAQAKASAVIQELYGEDIRRAISREEKWALARRLHSAALETSFDMAGKYLLLNAALGMYQAILDVEQAVAVAKALGAQFELDSLELQRQTIQTCAAQPLARAELSLHRAALLLMLRAAEVDRYDLVRSTGRIAEGSPHHKGPAVRLLAELDSQAKAYGLAMDPSLGPEESNLHRGIFFMGTKLDWQRGLPLLAASKAETISELSQHDQIGPMTPGARVKLAGRWWDLSEGRGEIEARGYAMRAAYWYGMARSKLAGMDLALAESRLNEARSHVAARIRLARDLRSEGWPSAADHWEAKILWLLPRPDPEDVSRAIENPAAPEEPVLQEEANRRVDPGLAKLAEAVDDHPIPRQLRLRGRGRRQLLDQGREGAIQIGLAWLSAHQDQNGQWDSDGFLKHEQGEVSGGGGQALYDIGITGLVLLSFLAEGNTATGGEYRDQVGRGLHWLCKQQDAETGLIGMNHSSDFIYNHALASLALAEAYAMSGNRELGRRTASALRYLENHRHPLTAWRYQPGDAEADLSITYWCASAYLTASWTDIEIDADVLGKLSVFLGQAVDPSTGRGGYLPGSFSSARRSEEHAVKFPRENAEAMTAAALFLKFMLGDRPDQDTSMAQAAAVLAALPPAWSEERRTIEQFYWMVGSQALRQYGGVEWLTWKGELSNSLVNHQVRGGNGAGSWDPLGPWGMEGGRLYSTAVCLLALQAEYRYADFFVVPARPLFSQVGSHWRGAEFDKVAEDLDLLAEQNLPPMDAEALSELKKAFADKLDESMARIQKISSGKADLATINELQKLEMEFGELEPGQLAASHRKRLMREPRVKREVDADKRLSDLLRRYNRRTEKGKRTLERELSRLIKRYPGTEAGKKATKLLAELKAG